MTIKPFQIPLDAVAFAAGRGRAEFPCLSTRYSPISRVPCVDFSLWLYDRIAVRDDEAVADFVWRVVEANPGVRLGGDGLRGHWKENARKLLAFPINAFLRGGTPESDTELRALMILILIHDSFSGFVMASDAARYVSTVMLPHAFLPTGVEELVRRGNRFIRTMRKDTPFWSSVPLFSRRRPVPWQSVPNQGAEMLLHGLRLLPIGTRAHFFDFVGRYGQKPLPEATSYMTRKRGLDAVESASLLERSGLVTRLKDSTLSGLASIYGEATKWAQSEIDRRIPFWQLWIAFGLNASAR
jgi:hypothetical protein